MGNSNPVQAKVEARIFLGGVFLGFGNSNYYNGNITWNLNPLTVFFGHFNVPKECEESDEKLTIEVRVTIVDIYEREHELLPMCFTYMRKENIWYLEPTSSKELIKWSKRASD